MVSLLQCMFNREWNWWSIMSSQQFFSSCCRLVQSFQHAGHKYVGPIWQLLCCRGKGNKKKKAFWCCCRVVANFWSLQLIKLCDWGLGCTVNGAAVLPPMPRLVRHAPSAPPSSCVLRAGWRHNSTLTNKILQYRTGVTGTTRLACGSLQRLAAVLLVLVAGKADS